ncbi:hypothetical protein E2562_034178 [Oryza meyeriana var. granulata]|uniref:DUF834 domain-containing protein n=1 Tax=Oryza meyeriana var. granulata TaxID=110450 RepID=A0A6G1ESG8_9ORYZ|nr:hypothetical protein E2562_034178 [Oryza meyeriana var. granulata]
MGRPGSPNPVSPSSSLADAAAGWQWRHDAHEGGGEALVEDGGNDVALVRGRVRHWWMTVGAHGVVEQGEMLVKGKKGKCT